MPNIRKRKTDRGVPFPVLERASKSYGINSRFHKKRSQESKTLSRVGYRTPKRVFTLEQELLLRDYLMQAADDKGQEKKGNRCPYRYSHEKTEKS
ncbi:histone-lysine N-methyltransferase PRDM9-like isoform X1, partial [Tachysurus ichikawai]